MTPVLPGGWALLGEQDKYVSVSPQRVRGVVALDIDPFGTDALYEAELKADGKGFQFEVMGAANETAHVSVLTPGSNGKHDVEETSLSLALAGMHVDL